MAASFRWILQLHKDVPKAARFYSQGLDFTINVCTRRWAELQSGPLELALMQSHSLSFYSNLSFAFHLFDHLPKREIFPLKFSCLSNFRPRTTHTEGGQEMKELESNYVFQY